MSLNYFYVFFFVGGCTGLSLFSGLSNIIGVFFFVEVYCFMVDVDQATVSSYVMLILSPVLGYFAVSGSTANAVYGVVSAVVMLVLAMWNEKHNSTVISGSSAVEGVDGE